MRESGAPDAVLQRVRREWMEKLAAAAQPGQLMFGGALCTEVFPENVQAFLVFLACASQWEMPGMGGGRCTVPAADVEHAIVRVVRVPRAERDDCYQRVQTMILAARAVILERMRTEAENRKAQARR